MDTNQLMDILNDIDQKKLEQFIEKKNAEYKVVTDAHSVQFDYSWIDKIEETLEYLDKIIRVPKKFLAQEEEVVPVERAKKISVETIRHLGQHTNLIQDVSEDGKITPSQVLTIFKEETFELYENRFINSLLRNLYSFIYQRKKATAEGSFTKCQRQMEISADTKVDSDKISFSMTMNTDMFEDNNSAANQGLSYAERIEKIEFILMDYMKSPLIKSLQNSLPVRSPIRKTNTILKNPNFAKALELWEFIERYDHKDRKEVKDNSVINDDKELEDKLALASFINYTVMTSLSNKKLGKREEHSADYYLKKVVQDFINENKEINATEFKDILNKSFTLYKQKKLKQQKDIVKEFERCIKKYNNSVNECAKIMKTK